MHARNKKINVADWKQQLEKNGREDTHRLGSLRKRTKTHHGYIVETITGYVPVVDIVRVCSLGLLNDGVQCPTQDDNQADFFFESVIKKVSTTCELVVNE